MATLTASFASMSLQPEPLPPVEDPDPQPVGAVPTPDQVVGDDGFVQPIGAVPVGPPQPSLNYHLFAITTPSIQPTDDDFRIDLPSVAAQTFYVGSVSATESFGPSSKGKHCKYAVRGSVKLSRSPPRSPSRSATKRHINMGGGVEISASGQHLDWIWEQMRREPGHSLWHWMEEAQRQFPATE